MNHIASGHGARVRDRTKPAADNPWVAKLSKTSALNPDDRLVLAALCRDVRRVASRSAFATNSLPSVDVLLDGWACRYVDMRCGRRQITAFLLPGDAIDTPGTASWVGETFETISNATFVRIGHSVLDQTARCHPQIGRAIRATARNDMAILRSWLTSLGGRSARERLAHRLCELHARMQAVGRVERDSFDMPLIQADLADSLGMTQVHACRMLSQLARDDLIVFGRGHVRIVDHDALSLIADFDPRYLGLRGADVLPRGPHNIYH